MTLLARHTTEPAIGRAVIDATISSMVASPEMIFRTVHAALVQVDDGCARARTPIVECARQERDSQPLPFLGWHEDEAVRLAEGWRFARRSLMPRTFARPDFLSGALPSVSVLSLDFTNR